MSEHGILSGGIQVTAITTYSQNIYRKDSALARGAEGRTLHFAEAF